MKKILISLLLVAVMVSCLIFGTLAANDPSITLSRTELSGGKYTITVSFADIPQSNLVEYAQILLTCRSSQHNIGVNSLITKVSGDFQITHQFNTVADSLLVLIEPTKNTFAGIGNGAVYTFTVSQSSGEQTDPGFDLSAILILKDGTEKEINARLSASVPAQPTTASTTKATTTATTKPTTVSTTAPTTVSTTAPTTVSTQPGAEDPCLKGHTFQNGFCIYCAEHDPNYDRCAEKGHEYRNGHCIYCLAKDPSWSPCMNGHTYQNGYCIYCAEADPNHVTEPTTNATTAATVPTTNATVPTTSQPAPTPDQTSGGMDLTLVLVICAAIVVFLGGITALIIVSKKKQ